MENKYFSTERNIQILIAVLKANGVRKVVASPGTTNFSLVTSLQNDKWFEIYSSVDERSAAYIACGLAAESGEAVMLSCTGATASRNYYPGMTEAFYRKLPILAVTSHQGTDRIGQLKPQNIDRRTLANDVAIYHTELPVVKDSRDEAFVTMEANKAVLELTRRGGGPVHINIFTTYSRDFSVRELPSTRIIRRIEAWNIMPDFPKGRVGVYIGAHERFSPAQNKAIDRFCATYNSVVFCDHTSGYYGRYRVLPTLALMQEYGEYPIPVLDLMIHIGGVSASTFAGLIKTKEVWRVNPDGEIRDPFAKLTHVFQMSEESFFSHYSMSDMSRTDFADECRQVFAEIYNKIPELPFSNIWAAQQLSRTIPDGALFHISASHSRRAWNIFPFQHKVESMCNVGCCGIDGCTSTLVGASLVDTSRLCYLVTGDLAFFYDLNVLGNRHIGKNIRILLVNNGIGGEFKLSIHYAAVLGEDADKYVAAGGHFGEKSPNLVKHFAQDLGFEYLSASDKESFLKAMVQFTTPTLSNKPMVFEIFTDSKVESDTLDMICHIDVDTMGTAKNIAKGILGDKGIKTLKKILGK